MSEPKSWMQMTDAERRRWTKKPWQEMTDNEKLDAYQDAMEDLRLESEIGEQLRQKLDQLALAHQTYMEAVQKPGFVGEELDDTTGALLDVVNEIVDWYTAEPPEPHDR